MKFILSATTSLALILSPYTALANPTGGVVTQGQATITTPNATTTQINQTSQNATLQFQTFNVDANEIVRLSLIHI